MRLNFSLKIWGPGIFKLRNLWPSPKWKITLTLTLEELAVSTLKKRTHNLPLYSTLFSTLLSACVWATLLTATLHSQPVYSQLLFSTLLFSTFLYSAVWSPQLSSELLSYSIESVQCLETQFFGEVVGDTIVDFRKVSYRACKQVPPWSITKRWSIHHLKSPSIRQVFASLSACCLDYLSPISEHKFL